MTITDTIELNRKYMPDAFDDRSGLLGKSFQFGRGRWRLKPSTEKSWNPVGPETYLIDTNGQPSDFAFEIRDWMNVNDDREDSIVSDNFRYEWLIDSVVGLLGHEGGMRHGGMPMIDRSGLEYNGSGGSVQIAPPDAFAFYLPFHHYGPQYWGVYLTLDGVCQLAWRIHQVSGLLISWKDSIVAARRFLFGHQQAHHKVEHLALKFELDRGGKPVYKTGFSNLYMKTLGTVDCIEEDFANASGIRRIRNSQVHYGPRERMIIDSVCEVVKMFPVGWQGGVDAFKESEYQALSANLKYQLHGETFPADRLANPSIWHGQVMAFDSITNLRSKVNYLLPRPLIHSRKALVQTGVA